jgi:Fe-S-cluster containining protein
MRGCGECSLCCTVLRVDELRKLGGVPCNELRAPGSGGGCCGIHERRPAVCRAYRCLWLQGGLEERDRPDRLGAVLDVVTAGAETRLEIHLAAPDSFERSPRLREIAERYRAVMPVRLLDVADVLDPDRLYRILLPPSGSDGAAKSELRVEGELITELRDGVVVSERRLPWLERWLRRATIAWRRRRLP